MTKSNSNNNESQRKRKKVDINTSKCVVCQTTDKSKKVTFYS